VVWGGRLAAALAWFDAKVVDGMVNGAGTVTTRAGLDCGESKPGESRTTPLASLSGSSPWC